MSRLPRRPGLEVTGLLAIVNVPILVAVSRALARGWQPLADNAIVLVRARDVGTANHPWLGMASSASYLNDLQVSHPGPLYFDVLAPAVQLLGPWVGLAVGVALINAAASSGTVLAARHIGGREAAAVMTLTVAALQYTLGSELLFDAWQPNVSVLPCLLALVLAWGIAHGDARLIPWFLGVMSFLAQTHIGSLPLVVIVVAGVAVSFVLRVHEGVTTGTDRRRVLTTSTVVVLAVWAQPLYEQFFGPGQGNLRRLLATAGQGSPAHGLALAARMLVEGTIVHPWFTRRSYTGAIPTFADARSDQLDLVSIAVAGVLITTVVLALMAARQLARRTGETGIARLVNVAALAFAAAFATLTISPLNVIGLTAHQMRWAWPVAAFATAAFISVGVAQSGRWRPLAPTVLLAFAAVVALANLPTHPSTGGGAEPVTVRDNLPAARALVNQLGSLRGAGPIWFDLSGTLLFEPYSGLTMAELQDLGIPFVLRDDPFMVRQLGERRLDDDERAELRLWIVEGDATRVIPPHARRVAYVADAPRGPVAILVEPLP